MGSVVSSVFGGGSGGTSVQAQQVPTYGSNPSQYNPYASQLQSAITSYGQADPLSQLRGLMSGNISALPGYQYALQQGLSGTAAQAASQGRAVSGNELAALNAQGSGIASQNYNNYFNQQNALQSLITGQLQGNVSNTLNASQNAAGWQQALTGMTQANNQGMTQAAQVNQANMANNAGGIGSLLGLAGSIGGTILGGPLGGAIGSGITSLFSGSPSSSQVDQFSNFFGSGNSSASSSNSDPFAGMTGFGAQ